MINKEKWNHSQYIPTVARYLGRIFPKNLFIKMNNKTNYLIQSWLIAEKYYRKLDSARVILFTPLRPIWPKILKTWLVGCLQSDASHYNGSFTSWGIFFLCLFLIHSATGSKYLGTNFSNHPWSLTMVSIFIIFLSTW